MKIVFKKIPKLAVYFYLVGFFILIAAIVNFFASAPLLSIIATQQLFIAGAIIVAIGSVINTLHQFKK
ncbi:MAG: hypothetical protein ACPGJI_08005 [Kangiellaceae bacterium]